MAVIEERKNSKGNKSFRVKVRIKGYPVQSATFDRKIDAKLWAQQTEVAIREGKYFNNIVSKRKLMSDLIDRYIEEIRLVRTKEPITWGVIQKYLHKRKAVGPYLFVKGK
ncbi:MAG: hypothetical protein HRT94_00350 [Alphaproteobacteria bacterium]|nr:hypothetical protein [Alphaproteobacteria bacterium]